MKIRTDFVTNSSSSSYCVSLSVVANGEKTIKLDLWPEEFDSSNSFDISLKRDLKKVINSILECKSVNELKDILVNGIQLDYYIDRLEWFMEECGINSARTELNKKTQSYSKDVLKIMRKYIDADDDAYEDYIDILDAESVDNAELVIKDFESDMDGVASLADLHRIVIDEYYNAWGEGVWDGPVDFWNKLNVLGKAHYSGDEWYDSPEDFADSLDGIFHGHIITKIDYDKSDIQTSFVIDNKVVASANDDSFKELFSKRQKTLLDVGLTADRNKEIIQQAEPEWKYTLLPDGTVRLDDYIGKDSSIIVPGSIAGFTVSELGEGALSPGYSSLGGRRIIPTGQRRVRYAIKEVILSVPIKVIGKGAFADSSVESVTIPDSVSIISEDAFSNCKHLETISFGNGLETIKRGAFSGIHGIPKWVFPEGLKTIEAEAFRYSSINEIHLPSSVVEIGPLAFGDSYVVDENLMGHKVTITVYGPAGSVMEKYASDNKLHFEAEEIVKGSTESPTSLDKVGNDLFKKLQEYFPEGKVFAFDNIDNNLRERMAEYAKKKGYDSLEELLNCYGYITVSGDFVREMRNTVKYFPGAEPQIIKSKIDSMLRRLEEYYPDHIIRGGIQNEHKSLAGSVSGLYQWLGYADAKTMLSAYGFEYAPKALGRPHNDYEGLIKAIVEAYKDKPKPRSIKQIEKDNPSLKGSLKTIRNQANSVLGMSLAKYLKQQGILAPTNSNEKPETHTASAAEDGSLHLKGIEHEYQLIEPTLTDMKAHPVAVLIADQSVNSLIKEFFAKKGIKVSDTVQGADTKLISSSYEAKVLVKLKALGLLVEEKCTDAIIPIESLITAGRGNRLIEFGVFPVETDGTPVPLKWNVVYEDDDKMLLFSAFGITARPYHQTSENVTWESCDLRKWLNTEFYNTAFNEDEKSRILLSHLDNSGNDEYGISGGNNTDDNVFLLSLKEAQQYLHKVERWVRVTPYAISNGAYVDEKNGNCWWWLRTPGKTQKHASNVNPGGDVYSYGYGVDYPHCAICPAVWVKVPKQQGNITSAIDGKIFVITGKVYQFKNREAFKAYVKENGGKVSDNVNVNTDYLVNNDIESTSTKNRTAKALGKPIITEQEFIERFGSPEVQQPTREDSKVEPVFLSGTHIDCAEEEIDAIREYLYKELGGLMEMIHEGQSAVSVSSSPDGLDVSYPIGEIDGYSSVYVQDIAGVFKSLKEKFPHIGILGIAYEYETVSAGTFGPYFYCSPEDKELKVTYEWQRCSICGRIFEKNVYYNSSQWDGGEGNLNCLCSPECMREYVNSNPDYERMVDASESMTEDEQEEYESAFEESDDDIYDIVKSILRKRFYK